MRGSVARAANGRRSAPLAKARRRGGAIAAVLAVSALGAGGDAPVPWPRGQPPSDVELATLVGNAVELADRERFEEYLEAAEKGEDHEHITAYQSDIDEGKVDQARLFRFGDALFEHEFRREDGYGDSEHPTLHRVHTGVRGGLDTFSCAGCHSVGGFDGAGSETENALLDGDGDRASTATVRNPPAVLGLGFVQALAAEMTAELAGRRKTAVLAAQSAAAPVTAALSSKGVSFGSLTALPSGDVDMSKVEGVAADLVVRPFGWKGSVARLRRFVEDAARVHFGIQSQVLALGDETEPDPAHLGGGPWWDPDGDGVQDELEEGTLTASAVYLAMLESPVVIPPHAPELLDRWAHGSALFDAIGCASCHRRELLLDSATWEERSDTTAGPPVVLNLLTDGDTPRSGKLVDLFSDLKRHDMGEALADPHDSPDGIGARVFLTRPLWGVAESPPYLHDGRASTLPAAILAHGGEAETSRDAFAALSPSDQADVHVFLLSLTREPKVRIPR